MNRRIWGGGALSEKAFFSVNFCFPKNVPGVLKSKENINLKNKLGGHSPPPTHEEVVENNWVLSRDMSKHWMIHLGVLDLSSKKTNEQKNKGGGGAQMKMSRDIFSVKI